MGRSCSRVQLGDLLVFDRTLVRVVDEHGKRHDLRGVVTPVVRTYARVPRGGRRPVQCCEVAAGELRIGGPADLHVSATSRVGLVERLRREQRDAEKAKPRAGVGSGRGLGTSSADSDLPRRDA